MGDEFCAKHSLLIFYSTEDTSAASPLNNHKEVILWEQIKIERHFI